MFLKKIMVSLFCILVVLSFGGLAFGYSVGGVPGWDYRSKININPQTPEADFQVKVELKTCNFDYSQAQSEGQDIRFASDSSGNNVLSYWIENWNTSGTSTIWVKVTTSGTATIYMFYGNSGVSSESDGTATFVYFADFESGLQSWTIGGTVWERDTEANLVCDDSLGSCVASASNYHPCVEPCAAHSGTYLVGTNIGGVYPDSMGASTNTFTSPAIDLSTAQGNLKLHYWRAYQIEGGGYDWWDSQIDDNSGFTSPTYVEEIGKAGGYLYQDGLYDWSETTTDVTSYKGGNLYLRFRVQSDGGWHFTGLYVDDVFIRKYADPQPTSRFSTSFQYKKQIVIDYTKVEADLTDFPVLIYLASDSDLALKAQDDGDDIAFSDSAENMLSHEIEYFNGTTGELVAWVKADLSGSSNTILYMYYGNSTACNQEDAANVWDSNFVGVWHLSESGTGTRYDSTQYDNDGTPQNYDGDEATTGKIDGADTFDGTNDSITVPSSASLKLGSGLTIEAWINIATWGDWEDIVFKGGGSGSNSDYQFALVTQGLAWDGTLNGSWRSKYFPTSQDTGIWIYVVLTHDTNTVKCYRDGLEISSQSDSGAIYESDYQLGISQEGANSSSYVDGKLDEVRISNTVRSASWIKTSYNNQNDPSSFFTIGAEQTVVELSYFRAKSLDSRVVLEWGTGSELDNEGFNILRSEKEDSGYFQINPFLIHSKGETGFGAEYSFTDYNVRNGVTYYYFLEDIDIYGKSTLHGPVSATPNDIMLIWPLEGEPVSLDSPFFNWRSLSHNYFKVDISFKTGFPDSDTLSFPKDGWTSNQYLLLRPEQWMMVLRRAQVMGGHLYWRVRAKGEDGHIFYSDSRELVFQDILLPKKNQKKNLYQMPRKDRRNKKE